MTVGHAIWPDQLDDAERAALGRHVRADIDRRPDVLVVGGGMLGVATAVACQRAGLGSVVLLERDTLGAGASGGAAGLLAPEAHVGVDPQFMVDLGRLSLNAWRELDKTIPGGVGLIDIDWLGLERGEAQFAAGLPPGAEAVSVDAVNRLVPGLSQLTHGVYVRDQARVNPLRAIARMAATVPNLATSVEVRGLSVAKRQVQAVLTSVGDFHPRNVVFATGLPPRLDGLQIDLPALEVKGHILASEPTDLRLPGVVAPLATVIEEGRVLIGGTIEHETERIVRSEAIASMWADLQADWPVARTVRVSHQWACFRPAHPDRVPVIDRVPGVDNAWLTSGHYKTGILMAPATGRALAEWIRSGSRPPEVESLSIDRLVAA